MAIVILKGQAYWVDPAGITHWAVGSDVARGVRLLWTACGDRDIPANAARYRGPLTVVDCEACLIADPSTGPV